MNDTRHFLYTLSLIGLAIAEAVAIIIWSAP
jgi:hypothetical protein